MSDKLPNLDTIYDKSAALGSLKQNLYDWHGANEWIFLRVNAIHGELYDHIMLMLSTVADHEHFIYYYPAIAAFAVLSILYRKIAGRAGLKGYISAWLGVLLVLGAGYPAVGLPTKFLKNHFAYERPYEKLGTSQVVQLEKQPVKKATQSFPSGHAVFIMFMIMALWPVLSDNLRWIGVITVIAVGWSRMAVGVHFPADVVTGYLLAFLIISVLRMIIYKIMLSLFKIHC